MKLKMAPTLIALALAAAGTTAHAADDWYTGIGAGWAYAHNLDDFGKDTDKDATALSLFGGYNFNDYYSAELGYLYAGKAGVDGADFKTRVQPSPVSPVCRWATSSRCLLKVVPTSITSTAMATATTAPRRWPVWA